MPMDIRSFFGSAPSKKPKKKPKPEDTNDVAATSTAASSSTKSQKHEAKKKEKRNAMKVDKIADKSSRHFSSSKQKKEKETVIALDNTDDSTTDDDKPGSSVFKKESNTAKAPSPKKRKAPEKETPVEISPEDFFAKSSKRINKVTQSKKKSSSRPKETSPKKSKPNNDDDFGNDDDISEPSPPPAPRRNSPRKAATATRKRIREEPQDNSDSDFADEDVYKLQEQDDDEDDLVVEQEVKPKPTPKPKQKASPPKKTSTPSPPKRTRKVPTPPKPKKTLLEPGLERDAFDLDKVKVPQLLDGLTFVFTGVLDDWHRDDAMDFVKSLGGRVTTGVSGKTDYLVVGNELEDGRPYQEGTKYRTAMEKSVRIVLGPKQLYGLCHQYHEQAKRERGIKDDDDSSSPAAKPTPPATATNSTPSPSSNPYAKSKSPTTTTTANPYAKKPVSNPYAKATSNPYAKENKPANSNPYAKANPYAKKAAAASEKAVVTPNVTNQLWVDRHAPQSTREILGNKEHVNKLAGWLSSWERNFNNAKAYGKTFSNPKGPWKAALLSGPPGIGKTTTATLVAKESGRDLLEFNASDARSKKALQNSLGDITGSQTLNFGAAANTGKKKATKLRCIIMDEVDGMGAGDRSGMAELIQMIKKSKVPIICICNDRQSQKMKSLLPYCLDLRFRRPTKSVMATRALRIAEQEGFEVERNAAEAIAESCGNDVRQVLNCLQMWAQKDKGSSLTYRGLKEREKSIQKDEILRVSLFDAAKTILEGRRNLSNSDAKAERDSLFRRSDAFFVDYSFTGLLVQQNYPRVMQGQYALVKRGGDVVEEEQFVDRMHQAAASMSDYAMVEHEIRSGDLNWSLLPACSMLTVQTGYYAGGENGGMLPGFPEFTAWMGKNSSKGKKMRLLSELHHHMNYKVSGSSQDVRESYLPVLREKLLKHLHSGEEGAAKEAIALMDDYGLSREDVMEKLDEFKMSSGKDDKGPTFADLDSKQKAAFTREYNQGSHKSQALVAEQGAGGRAKKSGGKRAKDPADLDAIDEDPVDEESDEEDDEVEMRKLQEKFKKKGRKAKGGGAAKGKKKKK